MIPCMTITKRLGRNDKGELTVSRIYNNLKDLNIPWQHADLRFGTLFVYGNATKSLKSIAKHTAFLQPHYSQCRSTTPDAMLDRLTEQNFDEAIRSKDQYLWQQSIRLALPADDVDIENKLRLIDGILTDCPAKNYKYMATLSFKGLAFGTQTLAKLPGSYTDGREEFMKQLSPAWQEAAKNLFFSYVTLATGKNSTLVTQCLLEEISPSTDLGKIPIPEKFAIFVKSIHDFKSGEIKRTPIYSVTELKNQQTGAAQKLAERTSLSLEEVQEESTPYYLKLTADQRITLENKLYNYLFGSPYADPPPSAGIDQLKSEYYLAKIRNDIDISDKQNKFTKQQIGNLRAAAAKAMSANKFESFEALDASSPARDKLVEYMEKVRQQLKEIEVAALDRMNALAQEHQLPHHLEGFYFAQETLQSVGTDDNGKIIYAVNPSPKPELIKYIPYHQIVVPEDQEIPPPLKALGYNRYDLGSQLESINRPLQTMNKVLVDGIACFVVPREREKFDRKKILKNVFKPLGYEAISQAVGSVGYYEFKKQLSDNEYVRCTFDFGTWRQTIAAWFSYSGDPHLQAITGKKGFRLPIIYWGGFSQPTKQMDITSEKLFAMAFDNIGYVANILEKEYVPLFRKALEGNRIW